MSSPQTETQESSPTHPATSGFWHRLRSYPIIPIAVLVFLLLIPAVTADWLAPHDPVQGAVADRKMPPLLFGGTWEYPLGTDRLGRDSLTR